MPQNIYLLEKLAYTDESEPYKVVPRSPTASASANAGPVVRFSTQVWLHLGPLKPHLEQRPFTFDDVLALAAANGLSVDGLNASFFLCAVWIRRGNALSAIRQFL